MYYFKNFRIRLENYFIRNLYNFIVWSFDSFLSNLISHQWNKSTISQINKSNYIQPCNFCDQTNNIIIKQIKINNLFGIFDKNKFSLILYYGTWIPKYIWKKYPLIRRIYLEKSFQIIKNKIHIKYLRCKSCDIIYQNYPHEEKLLKLFYENYYRRDGGSTFGRVENNESSHYKIKELFAKFFIRCLKIKGGAKVLDVGCAEGTFPLLLKKFNMISFGIEPAKSMVKYGKERLKLKNLKSGVYNESSYDHNLFDAINCHHVFEHLLNLKKTLYSFHLHLKSKSFLMISVPCIDYATTDQNYNLIMPNDHIYVFSYKWFKKNLPKYGFELVNQYFSPFEINVFGEKNPGFEFNVGPDGEIPGEIRVIAKKTS